MTTHVSNGVDVNVVFGAFGMGYERLNEEMPQNTLDGLDLLPLASAGFNPSTGFGPGFVQGQETALASTLYQLIWLCDEFGTVGQQPGIGDFGLVEDGFDGSIFGELQYSESWGWVMSLGRG